jgi:uncharacterized protein
MAVVPSLLGNVGQVTGSTVSVRQVETVGSGMVVIQGRAYRIGQVGTFVRIPQGYQDLFGIVTQVGASAVPEALKDVEPHGNRWLTIQLVGESLGTVFERGISQYPAINDEVHLVTESDLGRIYGISDAGQVQIGRLSSSETIRVQLDLDKLITRHCAVLGSTGSGKSTTIASLLRSISTGTNEAGKTNYPSARVLLLDIHGEYAKAMADVARVFRINPYRGEQELFVPFWALGFEDLVQFLTGGIGEERSMHLRDKMIELKDKSLTTYPRPGASTSSLTVDSPIPFSLHQLWYDLIEAEVTTFEGPNRDQPALVAAGNPAGLVPPKYKPWQRGAAVVLNQNAPGIRRQLENMRSRLLDHRFDFLLHPGPWEPALDGKVSKDLDALLESWLGHDRAITVLDLSGVPSEVLERLVGSLLKIVYESLFWSRDKSEGGKARPLLIVMEEAHSYLVRESVSSASILAKKIVKEGRKYGIGAMIVSQRPSEVDETILSQCGTFIALRLSNAGDRNQVMSTVPDSLSGLMDMLPLLRTGEAIITGEAARLPMRVRVTLPGEGQRPESEDPDVSGGWSVARRKEDYAQVVTSWRAQSPRAVKTTVSVKRRSLKKEEE